MDEDQLRRRVAEARVARVGTGRRAGTGPVMAVDIEQWSGWAYSD